MPYVEPSERKEMDQSLRLLMNDLDYTFYPGKLNYVLTRICDFYIKRTGLRYGSINDVIGVLECMKLELYRRVAADYEDQKATENGDVYSCIIEELAPLTDTDLEKLAIHDEVTGQTWFRCPDDPDCGLHLVGPGRVRCDHCTPDEDVIE